MIRFLLVIVIELLLCAGTQAQTNQVVTAGAITKAVNFSAGGCVYNWTNNNSGIGLAASGNGDIASFTAVNNTTVPIVATITAKPALKGFAYIPNSEPSGSISVVNVANNTVIATIPVGRFPSSASLSPDGSRLYVTSFDNNTVIVINTATNAIIATIPILAGPAYQVVVSPGGSRLYVSNQRADFVSVINTITNTVQATIHVGRDPNGLAITKDGGRVYVSHGGGNVFVINTSNNTVLQTINTGMAGWGIALSPDDSRLYVTTLSGIAVINTVTGAVVNTIPVGTAATAISINNAGDRLYVANTGSGSISVIDISNNAIVATIPVGESPLGVSLTGDGSILYVINNIIDNNVVRINTATNRVISTNTVGIYHESLGNFVSGPTCPPVTFTITVNPPPVITAGAVTGTATACIGTPSTSPNIQQFIASGKYLTGNIKVTAPPGFEVSLNAVGSYANTVILTQTGGIVNDTKIYVRVAALSTAGAISGNIVLSSSGSANHNISVKGVITGLPTVNPVADQIKDNGTATNPINFTGSGNVYKWTNDNPGIGLSATGTGNIASFIATNTGTDPVTANLSVSTMISGMAYISNVGANTVSVINTATNKVVSTIGVGNSPIGVSVSPDKKRVYVANSASGDISVIDAVNNTLITNVKVGSYPYYVVASPDGTNVYALNYNDDNVSVINAGTNTVTRTISVGDKPVTAVVSPDGSRLYVANYDAKTVSIINTINGSSVKTIGVGTEPWGMAISPDGSRVYVGSAYTGTIGIINTQSNTFEAISAGGTHPQGITVSPDGKWIYTSNSASNTVSVINAETKAVAAVITVGQAPLGISLTPDGDLAYVACFRSNDVWVINTASNQVVASVKVGAQPNTIGDFVTGGSICSSVPTRFKITVNSTFPSLSAGAVTGNISACAGSVSVSPNIQQFTVSAHNLSANVIVKPPVGFEVSFNKGIGYSNNLTISPVAGIVDNVIVYVRAAAAQLAGDIVGNVILSSTGASNKAIAVSGIIKALPDMGQVADQSLASGAASTAITFTGTANTYTWINDNPGIGLAASGVGNIGSFITKNATGSPIKATITVTPYLNSYAYIANSGDGTVSVINTASNAVVAIVPVGSGAVGVVATPNGKKVYVTDHYSNTVSVINTASNTVSSTIEVNSSYGIAVNPDGSRVYVTNNGPGTVTVINTLTDQKVAVIPVGPFPDGIIVSPDGGRVYVANSNSNDVSVIDAVTNSVVATITVGSLPQGIVISPDGKRLYVSNYGASSVSVVDLSTAMVTAVVPVGANPTAMAINADGSHVYVANSTTNTISIINSITNSVEGSISVGKNPEGVSVSPDGSNIYVTNFDDNTVSVINATNNTVIKTIQVGVNPVSLGNFITPGADCGGSPITFTITVDAALSPTLSTADAPAPVNTIYGTVSAPAVFTISGINLASAVSVAAPQGFEISMDNVIFTSVVSIPYSPQLTNLPVYIRLTNKTATGNYTGNIVLSSSGAETVNIVMPNSTVSPVPLTISVNSVSKNYGTTLTNQTGSSVFNSFGLKNAETVGSVNITYNTGAASNAAVNTYTGSVTPSAAIGGSFNPANYTITYVSNDIIVDPATLTITADNKSKIAGDQNPTLTVTYNGFVNNESTLQLSIQPFITTTATMLSAAGQYPIIVNGAQAVNYKFIYIDGILTVNSTESPLVIPNVFTPNGDGVNDNWVIKNIESYPGCTVEIFNRYGEKLFSSVGYGIAWDGRFKGSGVPGSVYYYVINLKNGSTPLSGTVTIIR
ncbi:beta-propeller fold lactonase family protein [Mucilaginibacter sp. cycad4]|uniref:YVTN family beta-propeller repeat protein n=1 Tax=Mucilaginibacter sp. cycad4 TaxID=3342096 RepID=UPI002AAA84E7|nr:beta-propeller fold lactonase family protein [Mucilaginibacter gossypii]WPV01635.1 beta-propeller fold lactonase family protein [Mucilaginibacter gossypii]